MKENKNWSDLSNGKRDTKFQGKICLKIKQRFVWSHIHSKISPNRQDKLLNSRDNFDEVFAKRLVLATLSVILKL